MSILLPRFEGSCCKNLTACGEIPTDFHAFAGMLHQGQPMIARGREGSSAMYLRVLRGDVCKNNLHIDYTHQDFFKNRKPPKITHTKSQLLALLDKAIGIPIELDIFATFVLPFQDLPERGLIRTLGIEQESAGMTIKLTAGRVAISGAPVERIAWALGAKSKEVTIDIKAMHKIEIKTTYLPDLFDYISTQFKLFVLSRGEDACR